jgi:hypothetical protein
MFLMMKTAYASDEFELGCVGMLTVTLITATDRRMLDMPGRDVRRDGLHR